MVHAIDQKPYSRSPKWWTKRGTRKNETRPPAPTLAIFETEPDNNCRAMKPVCDFSGSTALRASVRVEELLDMASWLSGTVQGRPPQRELQRVLKQGRL